MHIIANETRSKFTIPKDATHVGLGHPQQNRTRRDGRPEHVPHVADPGDPANHELAHSRRAALVHARARPGPAHVRGGAT